MIEGARYQHRHDATLTCEIVRETARGAQVIMYTNGKKPKKMFFDRQDFSDKDEGRAIWEKVVYIMYKIEGGIKRDMQHVRAGSFTEAAELAQMKYNSRGLIGRYYVEDVAEGGVKQIQ